MATQFFLRRFNMMQLRTGGEGAKGEFNATDVCKQLNIFTPILAETRVATEQCREAIRARSSESARLV
jgi:hypothetical protein